MLPGWKALVLRDPGASHPLTDCVGCWRVIEGFQGGTEALGGVMSEAGRPVGSGGAGPYRLFGVLFVFGGLIRFVC